METIAANDLKVKGVSSIQHALEKSPEAMISVRGSDSYVVMGVEEYNYLRVCELEAALYQTRQQVAAKEYEEGGVGAHLERIEGQEG